MIKKSARKMTIAATLSATLLTSIALPVTSANSHEIYGSHHRHHVVEHYHSRKDKRRDMIAAGIIGLAVGAIIADSVSRHEKQPAYVYKEPNRAPAPFQPAPTRYEDYEAIGNDDEPTVVRYEDEFSLDPWTPGWREWCFNRYRSFDPNTGTYRGYDGRDHFCVPK